MSKFLRENIFNILIFLLLSIQAFMYYYDNRPSSKVFSQKSMSVENFSSIVLSKSGLTKIGSEKLNKIDEDNFLEPIFVKPDLLSTILEKFSTDILF